ncbi:MAG: cytochrome d ubiquinol oxidase subunit II, partial [Alphaproteobacteria bacterium]|nr:cytochrome d ubiquinol oxidase subunit II [Alphaproteobacteria bacterium]
VGIGVVSLWTPIMDSHIAARWFDMPGLFILAPIPLLTLFLTYMLWVSIGKKLEKRPFFLSIGLFMMAYLGLGMSMWPYVVPRHFTFWDVASPYETQIFILVGIGLLIPFILGYTAYVFYVFRGKVKEHVGYH